jgi:hypothetical protein
MKQTAVEWLIEELEQSILITSSVKTKIKQAKEIEKEEKHAEYMRGREDGYSCKSIINKSI